MHYFTVMIFIYGLYKRSVCLYVGITVNPKQRAHMHRSSKKLRNFKPFKMCIFREVAENGISPKAAWERAERIEMQIIRAMRRRGQARHNTTFRNAIRVRESGQVFSDARELAARYGLRSDSVRAALKTTRRIPSAGISIEEILMKDTKRQRGRPRLNKPQTRMKITVDVDPATHAKLEEMRASDSRSFGRHIDAAVSAL